MSNWIHNQIGRIEFMLNNEKLNLSWNILFSFYVEIDQIIFILKWVEFHSCWSLSTWIDVEIYSVGFYVEMSN